MYRDDQVKTLIQAYLHKQVSSAVSSGVKGDSLVDIAKLSGKGAVSGDVVKFSSGDKFNQWGFTSGKTATVDMNSVFKLEKGAAALSKLTAGATSVKPKVVGAKGKGKAKAAAKKGSGVGALSQKLDKMTKDAKKSSKKLSGSVGMMTPGDKASAGTAQVKSFDQFKRMVSWYKKGPKK